MVQVERDLAQSLRKPRVEVQMDYTRKEKANLPSLRPVLQWKDLLTSSWAYTTNKTVHKTWSKQNPTAPSQWDCFNQKSQKDTEVYWWPRGGRNCVSIKSKPVNGIVKQASASIQEVWMLGFFLIACLFFEKKSAKHTLGTAASKTLAMHICFVQFVQKIAQA